MLKNGNNDRQWQHPKELLRLQKLKYKKQALQERINGSISSKETKCASTSKAEAFENIFQCKKRKNPFTREQVEGENKSKKCKTDSDYLDETEEPTLFKLLNQSTASPLLDNSVTSFSDILTKVNTQDSIQTDLPTKPVENGTKWCPVDWTLKRKVRLISLKPFPWSSKLKISEEASGITSFTRCLDIDQCNTSLDMSPNAKFHQCCLYWQQPFLPWLTLFPRNTSKNMSSYNLAANPAIKSSLYETWTDSVKSLFQLIKTRQCPYFYVCANNFTALFRAAGIYGHTDSHVMVTPTTRGFRHLLQEEDIEFEMPLKRSKLLESQETGELDDEQKDEPENNLKTMQKQNGDEDDEDNIDEEWLKNLGMNANDIKSINYTQARIEHKIECQVDSSDQSLILIEGVEVNSFFNFLINCKSAISTTGPLAGVPPTLLAPVSFRGATLNALKVRENKINSDGADYYCLELTGPILPSTIHNIFNINNSEHSVTMTFNDVENTRGYSKVHQNDKKKSDVGQQGTAIFEKENLSDCGLNCTVLKQLCSGNVEVVQNVECLKYCGDSQNFSWT